MGLFSRSGAASVTVTPGVVQPRQTVTATVSTDRAIDEVATATLEWGYDNVYRYHLPDDTDGNDGTDDRDTDDWVCVTRVELPVEASEFTGASATFKVPSWAPGSSPLIARWSCRVRIARGGGPYVDERGEFTVVIGTDDVDAVEEPLERSSKAAQTGLDVALGSPVYRAGETVTGQLVLRPTPDVPLGDVAVYWQRERESHPLVGDAVDELLDGPIIAPGKDIALRSDDAVTLPFTLALPDDAAPTAAAVHSSMSWYVVARVLYVGDGDLVERVRRPITVVNAP